MVFSDFNSKIIESCNEPNSFYFNRSNLIYTRILSSVFKRINLDIIVNSSLISKLALILYLMSEIDSPSNQQT